MMKIIDVTSSAAQANKAEMTEIEIRNLLAVRFLMRNIKLTSQAKSPESFKRPIKTIIPIKKRITSKDADFIKLSKSIVRVTKSRDVPKKAKLKRKSQKKSVPNMEAEKIDMAKA